MKVWIFTLSLFFGCLALAEPIPKPTPKSTPTPKPTPTSKAKVKEETKKVEKAPEKTKPIPLDKKSKTAKEPPTYSYSREEFSEISLSLRPGFQNVTKDPGGFDDPAFTIGTHISYFFSSKVALNVPYVYTRYDSDVDTHLIGGGPLLRYLEMKHIRGEVDAHVHYIRASGGNHLGWGAGADLTFGFPDRSLRPFLGPFFRYEQAFLPGTNLRSFSLGLGLTLTNLADLD